MDTSQIKYIKSEKKLLTKIGMFFARNTRLSLAIFSAIVIFGSLATSTLMKKTEFPRISVPKVVIDTSYYIDNQNTVIQDITKPIEQALLGESGIHKVESQTTKNTSTVYAYFDENVSESEWIERIKNVIKSTSIPSNYYTVSLDDQSKIDDTHDIVLSLESTSNNVYEHQEVVDTIKEKLQTLDEVAEVTPTLTYEKVFYLGDYGRSNDRQYAFASVGITTPKFNVSRAITIGINAKEGVTLGELSSVVQNATKDINNTLSEEYSLYVGLGDPSNIVKDEVNNLQVSALFAIILVGLILMILVNARVSLVALIFIPTVYLGTLLILSLMGRSLNIVSLFALILSIGIVVDDAVVLVEEISAQKNKGKSNIDATKKALTEIGFTGLAGTLTTIIVFIPFLFSKGILSEYFKTLPEVLIIALLLSFFFSITIIPLLSSQLIPVHQKGDEEDDVDLRFKGIRKKFMKIAKLLEKLLQKVLTSMKQLWGVSVFVVVIIFLALLGIDQDIPFSAFPEGKTGQTIEIQVDFKEDLFITEAHAFENILIDTIESKQEKVESFETLVGNNTKMLMRIKLNDTDNDAFKDILETKLSERAEVERYVVSYVSPRPQSETYHYGVRVLDKSEYKRETISRFIKNTILASSLDIKNVTLAYTKTQARENGIPYFEVQVQYLNERNLTKKNKELTTLLKDKLSEATLSSLRSEGVTIEYNSGMESLYLESFESLFSLFFIAGILMLIVLIVLFDSIVDSLLVLLTLPFSLPGIYIGLRTFGFEMSFFVLAGIFIVMGITVNNAIMLVDNANKRMQHHEKTAHAIAEAVKTRFLPVMTTTLTTIGALIPMIFIDSLLRPLVVTIIFGLFSSTVFVLVAFPAFFELSLNKKRVKKFFYDFFTRFIN